MMCLFVGISCFFSSSLFTHYNLKTQPDVFQTCNDQSVDSTDVRWRQAQELHTEGSSFIVWVHFEVWVKLSPMDWPF